MKKPLKIALILIGALFLIYTILGLTGVLKMFHIPTTANEPGIKLNSKIFVSNLADIENGDFVCYKYNDEMLGEHIRVHRLFGKSGDVVELKNGILFLNDKNIDKIMDLMHSYILNTNEFQSLLDKKIIPKEDIVYKTNDSAFVFLIDKIAEQNGLSSKIKPDPNNQTDKTISNLYAMNWNKDNFGPLKIPKGKCFVIGDNSIIRKIHVI